MIKRRDQFSRGEVTARAEDNDRTRIECFAGLAKAGSDLGVIKLYGWFTGKTMAHGVKDFNN